MPIHVSRLLSPSVQFKSNASKSNFNLRLHTQSRRFSEELYENAGILPYPTGVMLSLEKDNLAHEARFSAAQIGCANIDLQRVDYIKIALDNGRFIIDPHRVAHKLFEFEQDLA